MNSVQFSNHTGKALVSATLVSRVWAWEVVLRDLGLPPSSYRQEREHEGVSLPAHI